MIGDVEVGAVVGNGGGEELHGIIGRGTPGEAVEVSEALDFGNHVMNFLVVGGVDENVAMGEELELLGHLLLAGEEVLVVGVADIGKDTDSGLYDILQTRHLPHLGDAGLEDRHIVLRAHLPDGERHANLRVVALGAGDDAVLGGEELHEPILDDGLAVASGDAHHGDGELLAMGGGDTLEGQEDVVDTPEVGIVVVGGEVGRHHEVAHTTLVETIDIATTRVTLGGDGEEEGAVGLGEGAAVVEEMKDSVVGTPDTRGGAFYDGSDF